MRNIDQRGSFYLGREHDLATGQTGTKPLLYDSKDLTTHAVCVGMTGSGKTGLCLSLLEEAALDGVPAIAIDPKGDLGNLLLAFPNLEPEDFQEWVDPDVARQKGMTKEQFSQQTAQRWKEGLLQWEQDGERIRNYNRSVDKTIYTPGSNAGMPLTILQSFRSPSRAVLEDADTFRDRVGSASAGLLALLGIDADPISSREQILLAMVLEQAWRAGRDLDLPRLIHEIQKPPFERVGVIDLETFYPAADRLKLSMRLNNLLASPSFAGWLEGEPLDVQKLLYTSAGRPRLSILSIAHLNEAERMFFVTILLNEMVSWMRTQSGTSSLRALLYMDEVVGYFPPTANPPSKKPMLTLLKQARAYGLGCVLATQNPVDLDYKGLSNAGTWWLGRLQTERDKARVLEGLEGATAQSHAPFDRGKMEKVLASLGSRVFLMNNVHAKGPVTFHTRWVMSYLRGPLTRTQIQKLMESRKAKQVEVAEHAVHSKVATESGITVDPRWVQEIVPDSTRTRPLFVASIRQKFWPLSEALLTGLRLCYRPALLGSGKLHFVRASYQLDHWREVAVLQLLSGKLTEPVWEAAQILDSHPTLQGDPWSPPDPTDQSGNPSVEYDEFPAELAQEKNYKSWKVDLKNYLYRTESCILWRSEELGEYSRAEEGEDAFRLRCMQKASEMRDTAKQVLQDKYEKRLSRAQQRLRKATEDFQTQRSQFWARTAELVWTVADVLLSRKRHSQRRPTTGARRAMRERSEQSRAQVRLDDRQADWEDLQAEFESKCEQIERDYDSDNLQFDQLQLKPRKSDTLIDQVILVWVPWGVADDGTMRKGYV